jgi:anti-sigma regulatory factor (Ser/Thr protein kinase)
MTAEPAALASLEVLRVGGCVAWPLPMTVECARIARGMVGEALRELGVEGCALDAAITIASEFATNALRHSGVKELLGEDEAESDRPELWLYRSASRCATELVVAVFDHGGGWADEDVRVPEREEADPVGISGRGLQVVNGLAVEAGMVWGHHLSRARLDDERRPGNAAWFRMPIPPNAIPLTPVDLDSARATSGLADLLRARGLSRLYLSTNAGSAVLSVRADLTVWCHGGTFQWLLPDKVGRERQPVGNLVHVAELVVGAHEALTRRCRR